MNKLRISELTKTCDYCPSQWEGRLSDDRFIYIRFRHDTLSFGVGDTLDEAIQSERKTFYVCEVALSTGEMLELLKDYLHYKTFFHTWLLQKLDPYKINEVVYDVTKTKRWYWRMRCKLGTHHWLLRIRNEEGKWIYRCRVCSKTKCL